MTHDLVNVLRFVILSNEAPENIKEAALNIFTEIGAVRVGKYYVSEECVSSMERCIARGETLKAIRIYRTNTGATLLEGKDAVEIVRLEALNKERTHEHR